MLTAPSGLDTVQVRREYFRERRSRHFGAWALTSVWVGLGTVASWILLVGVSGLLH
jgi:hypothetical protein